MKVVCHELVAASNDPEGSLMDDLVKDVEKLVFCIAPKAWDVLKLGFLEKGLKELVKFGKFVEIEDTPAIGSLNVEVADEHVAPKPKFPFAIEEIELYNDEEDQENELTENKFEDFIQKSISNPKKDSDVKPPVVTERESD
ncbi:unnamed protein product [Lactuca saligna]|uniref:Uncharacterized protein n=1 Tax=Lactuca saligna TaxID=75948 RepID=A0AA35VC00_LACSI|nr:unnamed protein product [Lactuca saligna]